MRKKWTHFQQKVRFFLYRTTLSLMILRKRYLLIYRHYQPMVHLHRRPYNSQIFHICQRFVAQQSLLHTSHHSELQTYCNPFSLQRRHTLQWGLHENCTRHLRRNPFLLMFRWHDLVCLCNNQRLRTLKIKIETHNHDKSNLDGTHLGNFYSIHVVDNDNVL